MVQNLAKRFIDENNMQGDIMESLMHNLNVRIIGHGLRSSMETRFGDYMFPDFLMFCFHSGSARLVHNGYATLLEPGSFFVYKPFDVYTAELTSTPPFVFSYVYFSVQPWSVRLALESNVFQPGDEQYRRDWCRQAGASLKEFCDPGAGGLIGQKTMLEQHVKTIMGRLLYDKLNYFQSAGGDFIGVKQARLIDQTFACAERHLSEPISIDKVSKELCVSRTTLDRVFRETMQVSPARALTRFKIERSFQLMKQGHSVKEIAEALGYSSSFHFSKAFLSVMGRRPSSYMEFMNQRRMEQSGGASDKRKISV